MMNAAKNIELLIQFALKNHIIEKWDIVQVRNQIMEVLGVEEPFDGAIEEEIPDTPVPILNQLLSYAVESGLIEDTVTYRDMLDAKIMAQLMPRQSELIRTFNAVAETEGVEKATDFFYKLSRDSNYIRTDRIAKNEYWLVDTEFGNLEITINLSKPEKDPQEIAKAKELPQSNYPKCLLCLENVGYAGRLNHPARNNHRVIPVTLDEEQWYLQYSPYVYYNEHSIVFKEEHTPMKIFKKTFKRLLDFVEQYPHYFLGSNADLPIVGGSILSHDHFQGGHHTFAMEKAPIVHSFKHDAYPDVNIGIVRWPLSVVRLSSESKVQLIELADEILNSWRSFSDEEADIFAFSEEAGKRVPHNTITPIARMNQDGLYEIDLTLRNNRRSQEHPDGIFHPHQHLHHIKKENIGLIEVMGLAVLPARLKEELSLIEDVLTGCSEAERYEILQKHMEWINKLKKNYGTKLSKDKAEAVIQKEVGLIFKDVLCCAGVYKVNEAGYQAFERFLESIQCKRA